MITWEETIKYIRKKPEYADLVRHSYFDEDLSLNVERFRQSEEWQATCNLIKDLVGPTGRILDIGCGNGISSVALALEGYEVVSVDPDPSETVGIGAVMILKKIYSLNNLDPKTAYAENLKLPESSFDLVYSRQAMHHAADLNQFVRNLSGFLKTGGYLLTVRDHVIFNDADHKLFLKTHPLQAFYGGENAFKPSEYRNAFASAGLTVLKEIKHFESPINYFPISAEGIDLRKQLPGIVKQKLVSRLGGLGKLKIAYWLYKKLILDPEGLLDERKLPGRMYSYLTQKL